MKKILLITFLLICISAHAQCWEKISSGERHNIGIKTDGSLWGWGYNGTYGAIGNGNDFTLPSPVQIGTGTDWNEVCSGTVNSFAIKQNGTLWGWGANNFGQLGNGSSSQYSLVPVQIGTGLWKVVKTGYHHTVAIKADGTLWAWGNNESATIGDGTFINKSVPTMINASTNWKTIDCNNTRNIAIKEDGTLWVWGLNAPILGVTGMGSGTSYITVPTQVGTDTNWKEAVAGMGHFLALKNDNTLWAWGGGGQGKLGTGSTATIGFPTQIGTDTNWASIAADAQSSFGIKTDGTFWAWGQNIFGQLGNNSQINLLVPTQITTATDWKAVASSINTTVALKTDGSLFTWGSNQFGTLGNGTFVDSLIPLLINACNLNTSEFDKNQKIDLYPNPVQNHLFIKIKEVQKYQIFSILGAKISEGTLAVGSGIDCSNFTSGVYFISLTDNFGNVSTAKFVKE
jgi:alpha-tubulin suppressor-like RCC1 family protein